MEPHIGKIEIVSMREEETGNVIMPHEIIVLLDGRPLSRVQRIEVNIDVSEIPVVKLWMLPTDLNINLDDVACKISDKAHGEKE